MRDCAPYYSNHLKSHTTCGPVTLPFKKNKQKKTTTFFLDVETCILQPEE